MPMYCFDGLTFVRCNRDTPPSKGVGDFVKTERAAFILHKPLASPYPVDTQNGRRYAVLCCAMPCRSLRPP